MKPIRLTMQAFGSYGEKTEIDFTRGGDFFLISGDTGSGKSTIFDAMMFALYGEVSANGNDKKSELFSQFADVQKTSPYVELAFWTHSLAEGEEYTVRRTPSYMRPSKRKGAKPQREEEAVTLTMPDGSQASGNLRDVNARIQALIGLTAEQFRKVIMIAQGEFMGFLRAKSDEKTKLLRDLLKTNFYRELIDRLQQLAKDKKAEAEKQRSLRVMEATRVVTEGLSEADEQALNDAKQAVIGAKLLQPEQVDALAEVLSGVCARVQMQLEKLEEQETAAKSARDERMKREEASKLLMPLFQELEDAERTLSECAAQRDAIEQKRESIGRIRDAWIISAQYDGVARAQQALTDAQNEQTKLQNERPRLQQAATDATQCHQQANQAQQQATENCSTIRTKVERALQTFDRLDEAAKALQQAETEDRQARREQASAEAALQAFKKQEQEWQEQEKALQNADTEALLYQHQCEQYRQLKEALKALEKTQAEIARQDREATEKQAQYCKAEQDYQRAHDRYEAYRAKFLNAQAGLLAKELRSGKPCPVCGAMEHPAPCRLAEADSQLSRAEMEALREQAEKAAKQQEETAKAAQSARAALDTRRENAREEERKLLTDAQNARPDAPMSTAEEVEAMLTAWYPELWRGSSAAKEKQEKHKEVQEKLQGATKTREQRENALSEAQQKAKSAAEKKAAAEKECEVHQRELDAVEYKTREDAAAHRAQAEAAQKKAETLARQAASDETGAREAATQCETSLQRLNEDIPKKQRELAAQNQRYQQMLEEKSLDEAQWRALTVSNDEKAPDRLQQEVQAFDIRQSNAESQQKTAKEAIGGRAKPDLAQLHAEREAAEAALAEAERKRQDAKRLHESNTAVLRDLRNGCEPLKAACRAADSAAHLADVMAGKESGYRMDLETFVQRSYMERILQDANRRFRDMSRGQFELRLIDTQRGGEGNKNNGLEMEVYSIVTGKLRSTSTLSGGESFMAALSLALGMADEIQAATSAIHLDVMFIDEGFGSLDDHSRNEAIHILKEMAGQQRQIGIISHVAALKDEIENQLLVQKTDHGSQLQWRQ